MQESTVAARYAKAFFELVAEQGGQELHKANKTLQSLKASMLGVESLSLCLKDPILSSDEKKKVLTELLKSFEQAPFVPQFCYLLADKQRLELIPVIADQFSVLLDNKEGISRGIITTAVEVDENHKRDIVENLEKQTGRKLLLSYAVDPSLLGGMVLKINDLVLDSSLATQLNNLSQTIKLGGGE